MSPEFLCGGWNGTVAWLARHGETLPISGLRQASAVTVSEGASGTGAGAYSVVRSGSSAFGIDHRPLCRRGSRRTDGQRATAPVVRGLAGEDVLSQVRP